jgi:hypothetical protein
MVAGEDFPQRLALNQNCLVLRFREIHPKAKPHTVDETEVS